MRTDFLKLLVTASFVFACLILYQRWQEFTQPDLSQDSSEQSQSTIREAITPSASTADNDLIPQVTQEIIPSTESETPVATTTEEEVVNENDIVYSISNLDLNASFNYRGDLVRLELLNHAVELDGEPLPLFLATTNHHYYPQTGLIGDDLPSHLDENWRIDEAASSANYVVSQWTNNGITVDRKFSLAEDGYIFDIEYVIRNNSASDLTGNVYYQLLRDSQPPIGYSAIIPSYYGAAIYTDEQKYNKYDFDEFESYPKKTDNGWIAIIQRYFMAAWLDGGNARENFMRNLSNGDVAVGIIRSFPIIAVGDSVSLNQPLYAGALEQQILENINPDLGVNLKLAVDYGWLALLAAPLFSLLELFHNFVNNWGIAIILLTFLIKLVFFPLTAKSYKSMAKMRTVAPQMKKLKEKFGNDREAMQKATIELYRKEKINPLGGCLPILIQIPVFIALYWMLLEAVELRLAPFGLWLQDLSSPDPYFVLPVLLGAAMYGQFKFSPTPTEQIQIMVMKIMPIAFAAFSIIMPSGLVLYWIVNTLLSVLQQWQITRNLEKVKT